MLEKKIEYDYSLEKTRNRFTDREPYVTKHPRRKYQ